MSEGNPEQSFSEAIASAKAEVDKQDALFDENQRLKADNKALETALATKIDRRHLLKRGAQSILGLATVGVAGKLGLEGYAIHEENKAVASSNTTSHDTTSAQFEASPQKTESRDEKDAEYLQSGFRRVRDGIEITGFDIAAYLRQEDTSPNQKMPDYSFSLIAPDTNGVIPELKIINGVVEVDNGQKTSEAEGYPNVRLEILPPSNVVDSSAKIQLVLKKTLPDGSSQTEILEPDLNLPSVLHTDQGSNAKLFASSRLTSDQVDMMLPALKSAAEFSGVEFVGKVYDDLTFPFSKTDTIPDYIRKMAGVDAVFKSSKDTTEKQQIINYYETARSLILKIAHDPQFAGEKQEQIGLITQAYERYVNNYRTQIATEMGGHATQNMIDSRINSNPLFRFFNMNTYIQDMNPGQFGDIVNNPIDLLANALTIFNYSGDQFAERVKSIGNPNNSQETRLAYNESIAMADSIFSLIDLINPDKLAQHKYVAKLGKVQF